MAQVSSVSEAPIDERMEFSSEEDVNNDIVAEILEEQVRLTSSNALCFAFCIKKVSEELNLVAQSPLERRSEAFDDALKRSW